LQKYVISRIWENIKDLDSQPRFLKDKILGNYIEDIFSILDKHSEGFYIKRLLNKYVDMYELQLLGRHKSIYQIFNDIIINGIIKLVRTYYREDEYIRANYFYIGLAKKLTEKRRNRQFNWKRITKVLPKFINIYGNRVLGDDVKVREILEKLGQNDWSVINRMIKGMNYVHNDLELHAEQNALASQIIKPNINSDFPITDYDMIVTTLPCINCAKEIVANGIKRVYYIEDYSLSRKQHIDTKAVINFLKRNNVIVINLNRKKNNKK
jgi:deoxycytidylate deaminase